MTIKKNQIILLLILLSLAQASIVSSFLQNFRQEFQKSLQKTEKTEKIQAKKTYEDLLKLTEDFQKNKTFPGAQIAVFDKEGDLKLQTSGRLTYEGDHFDLPVDESTIYDMASLTKVMSTTSVIMKLYEQGSLGLQDKMVDYLPQADNNGKGEITIENLLLHNAGLPADYEPFDQINKLNKQQFLKWLYNCELQYPVGTDSVYSDLSMVFLQEIAETITGQSLSKYVHEHIFAPLNMTRTMYQPSIAYQSQGHCAPTTFDEEWRMQLLRCVVHDPTGYVMEGISGNAGLFSYYKDASKFMRMMVNYGTLNGVQIFRASTVKLFTTRVTDLPYANTRALGWDTCGNSVPVSCGQYFGANSFGHTGYTGTSLWADRDTQFGAVILTNRVYPNDPSVSITWFRNNAMNLICEINGY